MPDESRTSRLDLPADGWRRRERAASMIPKINQVQIRNYKSIGQAVVDLEPFTAFVGANGAGKSNFVDALAFVQECLSHSIELAFKNRGGIGAVRRRSGGHPTNIGIRLLLNPGRDLFADYSFEIAAKTGERFRVARERCVTRRLFSPEDVVFEVADGKFIKEIPGIRAKMSPDRLALFAASATDEFRPVYDFLTSMRLYSIVPGRLREFQDPDPGDFLKPDGSNAAAVLKHLHEEQNSGQYDRICHLLSKVVQGVEQVEQRAVGQKETLMFKQDVGQKYPWTFDAVNMSDGTLRVLGLLLAVYQPHHHSVVAIEEPEATVHPAAAELIMQVLLDAAHERQVLVTTHSPDILDHKELQDHQIRVVTRVRGNTSIAPVSLSGRQAIREKLYTPGELLRNDELNPDLEAAERAAEQMSIFGRSQFPPVEP
jgi:predicted ATPase